MSFCGNVLELVKKYKIFDDKEEFIQWTDIENDPDIEVYIEESIFAEIKADDLILIDAVFGEVNGKKTAYMFMKKNKNVYG